MANLILAFTLFFFNPDFSKADSESDPDLKVLEEKLTKMLNKKATTPCHQESKKHLFNATNRCKNMALSDRRACYIKSFEKFDNSIEVCNKRQKKVD